MTRPAGGGESGQTTTEYLMILGLLTAIIVAVTGIIVPFMGNAITRMVRHMVLYVSST